MSTFFKASFLSLSLSVLLILMLLADINLSFAQDPIRKLSQSVLEEYQIEDLSVLPSLSSDKTLTIDHVSSKGFTVYGPLGLKEKLLLQGIPFKKAQKKHDYKLKGTKNYKDAYEFSLYLSSLAKDYPHLLELFSIGKSTQGRDLLVMKVASKKYADTVRPKFRYIANIHGDETVGREILRLLIEDLVSSYGKDAYLTSLLDTTEIFIMPSLNPDGFALSQRGNAHGIDLNRNFPEFSIKEPLYTEFREAETQAMMNLHKDFNFALGGNFHGGAVVVNYPWDSIPHPFPLQNLIKGLSQDYASLNPSMKNSDEFQNGMINGYFWYPISGGLQDFSYAYYGTLDLTLEVSELKYPPFFEIDKFYEENRESMIKLISRVHQGMGFKLIKDSPIPENKIQVRITDLKTKQVIGTFALRNSEFYKVLPASEYKLELIFKDNSQTLEFTGLVEKDRPPSFGHYELIHL